MKDETAAALNEINLRFYRERASEFSATRERPWAGWTELFDRFCPALPPEPRVLDIGCGNGRFARFLLERLGGSFSYVGVDQSPLALEAARRRLEARKDFVFLEHDFVASGSPTPSPLVQTAFDLIVLFGVVHHIPGRRRRREILERLAGNLVRGGFLAFTLWRFAEYDRFRRKLVPWSELGGGGTSLDPADLEPGDYLMGWGGESREGPPALRYCHAMSVREEQELESSLSLSLSLVSRFDAGSEPNRYYLFRNPGGAGSEEGAQ